MNKAVLIFSGYNQRAVVAFLRTLTKNEIPFGIIASSNDDPVFLSAYTANILAVRGKRELDIVDLTRCIKEFKLKLKAEKYLIAPSTEALNRFLVSNTEVFRKEDCETPLVSKNLYEKISDKYSFGNLCEEYNILVPPTYKDLDSAKIPFVAKPKQYTNSRGMVLSPVLVVNNKDKKELRDKFDTDDFYFQELIEGKSLYLLYYFYKNGRINKLSQQNLIQQPNGKSIIAAVLTDLHLHNESKKYEDLFTGVRFSGLVMVEVKKRESSFYMVEANPRFWGPSQLFVDSGCNLFEDFLSDNGLLKETIGKINSPDARYFWQGGITEAKRSKQELAFHNYSAERLKEEFSEWMEHDVYNRKDTLRIYKSEMSI